MEVGHLKVVHRDGGVKGGNAVHVQPGTRQVRYVSGSWGFGLLQGIAFVQRVGTNPTVAYPERVFGRSQDGIAAGEDFGQAGGGFYKRLYHALVGLLARCFVAA